MLLIDNNRIARKIVDVNVVTMRLSSILINLVMAAIVAKLSADLNVT